ncbi:Transposon Tn21 resolvase [Vibrio coralliirubri]|uniref:recombinase family protein n=1 Tax=Vibrio coralliirubri TaxID=1516159 RepID=UPI000630408F|nr:recombinase family protein [Vibrio coralliirubri]CDT53012.1 Transposon Tn21 resolvase [Vibrio coralliirubri]
MSTTNGQNVGYIRVSAAYQNTDRQLDGVQLDRVFEEKLSASTIKRPELQSCLKYLRDGDTLHIHSLDRVCRSGAGDAVKLVEELTARGVNIVFHKDGLQFYSKMTATQKGILGILATVAQMERELILERQAEGLAKAKAKGKVLGRPAVTVDFTLEEVSEWVSQGSSKTEIAKSLGISRAKFYQMLNAKQNMVASD